MKRNEGIILHGGSLKAEQLAVGNSAVITNNSPTHNTELLEKVGELITYLEIEKSKIENYNDIKNAGMTLKDELKKDKPDKNVLGALFSMMSNGVPTIAGLTKTVKVVKELIAVMK
jgi:hypothetical protein